MHLFISLFYTLGLVFFCFRMGIHFSKSFHPSPILLDISTSMSPVVMFLPRSIYLSTASIVFLLTWIGSFTAQVFIITLVFSNMQFQDNMFACLVKSGEHLLNFFWVVRYQDNGIGWDKNLPLMLSPCYSSR